MTCTILWKKFIGNLYLCFCETHNVRWSVEINPALYMPTLGGRNDENNAETQIRDSHPEVIKNNGN